MFKDNTTGAMLMMGSMLAFTLNDACMKALSDELPLFQAIFLRGLATCALMYVLARVMGKLDWNQSRSDWALIALRTLAEIGGAFCFITALFNMPIANATAILQALPLSVTLAGALLFGEAVGWRRLSAILVGFVGVMLIVRPGTDGFNVFSLYALGAVILVTLRDLAARRLSRKVPTLTVAFVAALGVTAASGVATLGGEWAPVSTLAAAQLAGACVLIIGGYVFSVSAMRVGEVAVVSPFRYTSLLWALVLGLVVFGEWPALATQIGALIVVASGVYTFARERKIDAR